MGVAAKVDRPMTVEEFLAWDPGDDLVYELIDGYPRLKFPPNPEIEGHAAPSDEHGVIVQNIAFAVETAVRAQRRPCRVIPGHGQKVVRGGSRFRMPDLAVKCGRRLREARDPVLIVEVLSPSNTLAEMAEREDDYRALPSLREYVTVEQDRPTAVALRRRGELWACDRVEGLDAVLRLECLALDIPLRAVYRGVLGDDDDPLDGSG